MTGQAEAGSAASDAAGPLGPLEVVLSVVAVYAFAVVQPLLGTLSDSAPFFVAHGLVGARLVAFTLLLAVVVPLVLAGIVVLLLRAHRPAGVAAHALVVGGLATAALLSALVRLNWPAAVLVGAAVVVAAGIVLAYHRVAVVRSFVHLGVLALVLFVGAFLLGPSGRLVSGTASADIPMLTVESETPVVVVILDELPTATLMDADGHVDAELFPTFARLEREATWFRGTTAAHAQTRYAIPPILTGMHPDPDLVAVAADHPRSLFTLLGASHEIVAVEPVTELCPPGLCEETFARPQPRPRAIATDLTVLYAHTVLPAPARARVPEIGDRWAGFGEDFFHRGEAIENEDMQERAREALHDDRVGDFRRFVAEIESRAEGDGSRPPLYLLHTLLPHSPWQYLPSGQDFQVEPREVAGRRHGEWADDGWLAVQAQQRHLLQTVFVDRLLGELLDTLDRTGLYDDALLVVTADHGVGTEPGLSVREAHPETIPDIVSVPLFVKAPGQTESSVDDGPVMLIDLLPTIADVLGIDLPWEVDGVSAFRLDPEARPTRAFHNPEETLTFTAEEADPMRAVERRLERFPEAGLGGLYLIGEHRGLIGEEVAALRVAEASGLRAGVEHLDVYDDVDPDGRLLPACLWGILTGDGVGDERLQVAIALNGRVAAVTRTYDHDGSAARFTAILLPDLFVPGRNEVEVFLVEGRPGRELLRPVTVEQSG